jgi:hypothetical protein
MAFPSRLFSSALSKLLPTHGIELSSLHSCSRLMQTSTAVLDTSDKTPRKFKFARDAGRRSGEQQKADAGAKPAAEPVAAAADGDKPKGGSWADVMKRVSGALFTCSLLLIRAHLPVGLLSVAEYWPATSPRNLLLPRGLRVKCMRSEQLDDRVHACIIASARAH